MMPRYDARRIEAKWQQYWQDHATFQTPDSAPGTGKLYVLDMFPYPSGDGLHVGHPEGYTATDIVCRYNRMKGRNVLHPMGWDAFGLPAEQHAIQTGTHPQQTTYKNIGTFRRQLKMLGFSYDWSRELATTDPGYFRWTQWIFLTLFDTWYDPECQWTGPDGRARRGRGRPIAELPIDEEIRRAGPEAVRRFQDSHRLAYQHEAPVNWCPALGTVLANEEVIDGKSERGSHPVVRIPLRQWMLRITAYADRLLDELDELDWPDSIKSLQRNWIGRSDGADVDFLIGRGGSSGPDPDFKAWVENRRRTGFPKQPGRDVLRVFTTRPDTLFGATYMVIAPEHPLVEMLTTPDQKNIVDAYCRQAASKSDLDRTDLAKEKSGVFTGSYALNPVNGDKIPIWVADYVLISYGTGAIMAVPAHDLRDWEFAVTFNLPIKTVVRPPEGYQPSSEEKGLAREVNGRTEYPFAGEGTGVNSGKYDGRATARFKKEITKELASGGLGRPAVNYRLRDWLFSRQHYWGEPFPIWHELDEAGNPTGLLRAVPEEELPVTLPDMIDFRPSGRPEPPLAKAPDEWLYKTDLDGVRLRRETNSMPQWAGSCWYYLRFIDPRNDTRFVDPEKEKYWMPVDLYVGGAEHAVLHLLYSRFWHKVLFDRGHVSTTEPFRRLVNQGMILGEAELTGYRTENGRWVSAGRVETAASASDDEPVRIDRETGEPVHAVAIKAEDVTKQASEFVLKEDASIVVESRAYKMSKSRGNVINPDTIVEQYGADALRLYEMFMGPLEATKPWNMSGVDGIARFLGRVWRMITDERAETPCLNPAIQDVEAGEDQLRLLHKTIKAVSDDIEKLSFNTAISRLMEFTNVIGQQEPRPISIVSPFVLLLSPLAPHIAEELWELLGHAKSLAYELWPAFDEQLITESEIEVPVQVNGKMRGKVQVAADSDEQTLRSVAAREPSIARHLDGKTVVKAIVVPGRLVNFVVK